MRKLTNIFIPLFLSITLFSTAFAADSGAPAAPPKTASPEGVYVPPDVELVEDYCPPVETLVRDPVAQTWSAPNGWKTTALSFLRTLDAFAGAQWVGVGVGEIICVYVKTDRNIFPVTLQRGKLVPAPKVSEFWSADKGGYSECKSNDVKNCPFFVQTPKAPGNIYEQLDFYKGMPTEHN